MGDLNNLRRQLNHYYMEYRKGYEDNLPNWWIHPVKKGLWAVLGISEGDFPYSEYLLEKLSQLNHELGNWLNNKGIRFVFVYKSIPLGVAVIYHRRKSRVQNKYYALLSQFDFVHAKQLGTGEYSISDLDIVFDCFNSEDRKCVEGKLRNWFVQSTGLNLNLDFTHRLEPTMIPLGMFIHGSSDITITGKEKNDYLLCVQRALKKILSNHSHWNDLFGNGNESDVNILSKATIEVVEFKNENEWIRSNTHILDFLKRTDANSISIQLGERLDVSKGHSKDRGKWVPHRVQAVFNEKDFHSCHHVAIKFRGDPGYKGGDEHKHDLLKEYAVYQDIYNCSQGVAPFICTPLAILFHVKNIYFSTPDNGLQGPYELPGGIALLMEDISPQKEEVALVLKNINHFHPFDRALWERWYRTFKSKAARKLFLECAFTNFYITTELLEKTEYIGKQPPITCQDLLFKSFKTALMNIENGFRFYRVPPHGDRFACVNFEEGCLRVYVNDFEYAKIERMTNLFDHYTTPDELLSAVLEYTQQLLRKNFFFVFRIFARINPNLTFRLFIHCYPVYRFAMVYTHLMYRSIVMEKNYLRIMQYLNKQFFRVRNMYFRIKSYKYLWKLKAIRYLWKF